MSYRLRGESGRGNFADNSELDLHLHLGLEAHQLDRRQLIHCKQPVLKRQDMIDPCCRDRDVYCR